MALMTLEENQIFVFQEHQPKVGLSIPIADLGNRGVLSANS
jgi:hypothetical protein